MRRTILLLTLTFGLSIIFTSCSEPETEDHNSQSKKDESSVKIEVFNDISQTQRTLAQNGIGELGNWKSDGMGGFMSITNYHEFGSNSTGMKNNLAYYLESDNEAYIDKLKLVLNINNENEKEQALSKFKDLTVETFNDLSINLPKDLSSSIENEKEFQYGNESYNISLKLDKSNMDTWKLIIDSKKWTDK